MEQTEIWANIDRKPIQLLLTKYTILNCHLRLSKKSVFPLEKVTLQCYKDDYVTTSIRIVNFISTSFKVNSNDNNNI